MFIESFFCIIIPKDEYSAKNCIKYSMITSANMNKKNYFAMVRHLCLPQAIFIPEFFWFENLYS